MNIEQLYQKLVEAVRSRPADDRVPYAFEQRVMARLRELPQVDLAAMWGRNLWRAAVPFACVALAIAVWTRSQAPVSPAPSPAGAQVAGLDDVLLAPLVTLETKVASW